jgi:phosphoserine aminotransferase
MSGKPNAKPVRPWFSSGPTAKRPGWSSQAIPHELLGRGIRAPEVVERFAAALRLTRELLQPPADWRLVYVPGSDTGAMEAAMWSMLGERPVQVLAFENFGQVWATDLRDHLELQPDVLTAPWGGFPDVSKVDPAKDLVLPWNGTTSGVKAPDGDWISAEREGLVICDATSAAFAMPLPWPKLDVITWSWQKVLGGEAAHGMLALSPRAVQRLESFVPPRPLPKIFRLTKNGKLNEDIFKGSTINTPTMLCVEHALDSLRWAESVGGQAGTIERSRRNLGVISRWVEKTPWVEFLAQDPATRSCTSVCLKIVADWFQALPVEGRSAAVKRITALLDQKGAAHDIGSYVEAPPGLRIWRCA